MPTDHRESDAESDRNLIIGDDESAAAVITSIIRQPGAAVAQVAISDAEDWQCHFQEGFFLSLSLLCF